MLVILTCLARTLVEVTRAFMSTQLSANNQPAYVVHVVAIVPVFI